MQKSTFWITKLESWEHHLPEYLITVKAYKTATVYLAYSNEKSSIATVIFIDYFYNYGIDLETITIRTDYCKGFINPNNQKITLIELIITEQYKAIYRHIPYRRPTYNSQVGSFHNFMKEFFIQEKTNNETELLANTFAH